MASVFGKAGRAITATDPAPPEMIETVINLQPEADWRPGMTLGAVALVVAAVALAACALPARRAARLPAVAALRQE